MEVELEATGDETEVQMGPLIDCVFLLLIFFIVVAITKKTIKQLAIQLPQSTAAVEEKHTDDTVVIRVTEDGRIYLGSDEMTTQTLKAAIRERAKADPDRPVRIEADQRVRLIKLAPIIEECQFSGLNRLAIRSAIGGGGTDY